MQAQLISVLGNSQRLDGGAMFGNAPRALWSRWFQPDELNRIPLACRCLLVREPAGRNILLETGIGAFFPPKLKERYGVVEDDHVLLSNLAQLGLEPNDIDVIILSHLHFDHAGGLLGAFGETDANPSLAFKHAKLLVSAAAWKRAVNPHSRDRASFIPEVIDAVASSGNLELVDSERSATLGDGFRFHVSEGHTPGLMLTEIADEHGPTLFAADLVPGCAWMHTAITMGYDRFPEKLADEKASLLADLHDRGGRLFFTHDPKIAAARITRNDNGRYEPGETWGRLP